jgi:hypothetical protein
MPVFQVRMLKCDGEGCCRNPVVVPWIDQRIMVPSGWTESHPQVITLQNANEPVKFFCPEHSEKVV